MVTIGDRESIFSRSFIIPVGEDAKFTVPLGSPEITFILRFLDDKDGGSPPMANWIYEANVFTITFSNWRNSLGAALQKTALLGDIGGKKFGFNVVNYAIAEVNFLTFELYNGGTY